MTTKNFDPQDIFRADDKEPIAFIPHDVSHLKDRRGFYKVARKANVMTKTHRDPNALFQVNDEEPITFEHLLRANPELADDEIDQIREMLVGQTKHFGHARLRRTR